VIGKSLAEGIFLGDPQIPAIVAPDAASAQRIHRHVCGREPIA
jgi:hypothetical protein